MANRSYLYALSNQPKSYSDRPVTITGLSEWPYDVPLFYLVLLSGNPRVCASLISDGLEDSDAKLYAVSGEFDPGFKRAQKFLNVLRHIAKEDGVLDLLASCDEAETFLNSHKDKYFLLETIELDVMTEPTGPGYWRECAEQVRNDAMDIGADIDKLPDDAGAAAQIFRQAAQGQTGLMGALDGRRFDETFDHVREGDVLGVSYWSDVLYFDLWNKDEFEAAQSE